MYRFTYPIQYGRSAHRDGYELGFSHNGYFIVDPTVSVCGRFEADPVKDYGLKPGEAEILAELNQGVMRLADSTLYGIERWCQATCLEQNTRLLSPSGTPKAELEYAIAKIIAATIEGARS